MHKHKSGQVLSQRLYHRRSRAMFWDFEIGLAEAVLKCDPDNLEALHMMGNAMTRSGRHREALQIDRKLVELLPSDPVSYYNLACSYSNLGEIEAAYSALAMAIARGYRDIAFMKRDPDLRNLRKDPRFLDLLIRYGTTNS